MAQLINGLFGRITGKLGGISFYIKNGKQECRICKPINGYATNPKYDYLRKNAQEFGRAAKATTLFRGIGKATGINIDDPRCFARLQSLLLRVIKSDTVNEHGNRTATDGNLNLLSGFQFDEKHRLPYYHGGSVRYTINRLSGKAVLRVYSFAPAYRNDWINTGATHFGMYAIIASVDFESGSYKVEKGPIVECSINNYDTGDIILECGLKARDKNPWFVLLAAKLYKHSGNDKILVRDGSYQPLMIAAVSTV